MSRACMCTFVNDGSKDRSLELIQEACKDTPHFYYISLKQNRGLSAAMKAGIDTAESKYVGYMDADMQTDVRDFDLLLKYAPEYPLVMGIRAQAQGFCVQADAVQDSQLLPPYDDARRSDRHGLSAENPSYRLCKACSVLYRHAPFPSGIDTVAGRRQVL